ncbi:unnamed protein product [Adineta steineri]|uniref:Uncharacterized protein n=1 Tax=Adineta steineri TaxID=433720 RepID=A0A813SRS6_9BILA|nr:unnamed protein product [Adineta steineri]CAF1448302.1 unnamed protein product [Adineta steineri]CAF3918626.1 unnamed protein product [Adineta steineri]CAF3921780.1 unnamed protein product [Adineta steineri]
MVKSTDLQQLVLQLHSEKKSCRDIVNHLRDQVTKSTVNRWIKQYKDIGEIQLKKPTGRKRTKRTKRLVNKIKSQLMCGKRQMSTRALAKYHNCSKSTILRLLHSDLGYKAYVKRVAPKLTDTQREKRLSFAIYIRKKVRKSFSRKILFSDEKRFNIDGLYNKQNDRVWAPSREEATANGGIYCKSKFPQGVMIWLGVCYNGVTRPVIIEKGTIDHRRYIDEILPVAVQDGTKLMGCNFLFQQDGATPHTHHLTQAWCQEKFWKFWPKSRWPPNSPDLNPLDYSIWYELCSQMQWNKVHDKKTLISQIRLGVKKIRIEVVRRSIDSFTKRIYRLLQTRGHYISK